MPQAKPGEAEPKKRKAWVVDDSPLESEIARRALSANYDLQLFAEGSAMLEQLAAQAPPDVLVLDWVMPGLSGIELCQFLRARPETAELPVLLLTTNQQTEQIVEGLSAGANDYLIKPYAGAELRARVESLIRSRTLLDRARHAESLLRMVLRQLPDAVVTIDFQGTVLFVNPQGERAFGASSLALVGRKLSELLPDLALGKIHNDASDKNKLAHEVTLPDVTLAGKIYAPHVSIPPSDDRGNTTFTLRDVTDLRAKESRRLDFYSMVAHDLRSPLNALQMRAQMLQQGLRGVLSPEVKAEVEKMNGRVRDLVHMVNDFLEIAQMETAHFHLDHEELDLAEVCAQVYEEYQSLASARGLKLSLEAPAGAFVQGDQRRLGQVVGNLVANALKFTASGGLIRMRLAGDAALVELSVEDNGRGIPEDAQRRLFTKYERAGASASKVEGTGLGLVIVKEIVEAHGGTVGVRSLAGEGSTFWLRLARSSGPRS